MAEEISTMPATSSSMKLPQRTNPHDIRNADLVSRFLAATPPYLYSPPTGPHNFFFSEMLRSLVQAKANEQTARNLSQLNRQSRKRTWNRFAHDLAPKPGILKELKDPATDKPGIEKPLELTNKLAAPPQYSLAALQSKLPKESGCTKYSNASAEVVEKKPNIATAANTTAEPPSSGNETAPAALGGSSDVVLPPPPPMWYPPLYPPYGIDPFHFFIDLRVSAAGHIYDRKKENASPSSDNNNTAPGKFDAADVIGKPRHGSAFSVPPPRRDKSPSLALNLTSSPGATLADKSSVLGDYRNSLFMMDTEKEAALKNAKNTNYVLQNLPRIYKTMMPSSGGDDHHSVISDGSDSKSCDSHDIDVKDEDRDFSASASDDVVVIVDCQDMDDAPANNGNAKHLSY